MFDCGFEAYTTGAAHEAGFDAYQTGLSFLRMSFLNTKESDLKFDTDYENKVFYMNSCVDHFNLAGMDSIIF